MRTMTVADLCDECELTGQTATTVLVPPFDSYEKEDPCPNCRHQTPTERVVEAARGWADLDSMDIFDDDFLDACEARNGALKQALADLDQHTG